MSRKNRKPAAPTYRVEITDETGMYVFGNGYPSAIAAARAIAGVFPEIDADVLAADGGAFNESGSTRLEIGQD